MSPQKKPLLKRDNWWETQFILEQKVVALKQLWVMKEQSQNHARKRTKSGCYLRVTLVYKGLTFFKSYWIKSGWRSVKHNSSNIKHIMWYWGYMFRLHWIIFRPSCARSLYRSSTRGPEDDPAESKHVAPISHYMFNITTVVFDGPSPPFILQTLRDGTPQVQLLN